MKPSVLSLICIALALAGCIEDVAPQEEEMTPPMEMTPEVDASMGDSPDAAPVEADMAVVPPMMSCGNEDEFAPNQSLEEAALIDSMFRSDALFICPDTQDWFRLDLEVGQTVTLDLLADPPEADLDLILLDAQNQELASSVGETGEESLTFSAPAAGAYYVRVEGYRMRATFYSLSVSGKCQLDAHCPETDVCDRYDGRCVPLPQPECGQDDYEVNNRDNTPTALPMVPASLDAVICAADRDWYTLVAEEGDSFDILVAFEEEQDIDLFLIDANTGRMVASETSNFQTNPERMSLSHLPAGEYRLGIVLSIRPGAEDRDVDYVLEVSGRSGACEIDRDCATDGLPLCVDGTCQAPAPGAGLGERCGRDADCGADAEFCYTGGPGGHDNFCSISCRGPNECGALGENGVCVPVARDRAVCYPGCRSDDDCGIFYGCDEGRCELRGDCRADDDCGEGEICRPSRNGDRYCAVPTDPAECGADPDLDPNNVAGEASRISFGEPLDNLQICDGDDDWYALTVPEAKGGWTMSVGVEFRAGVDIDIYVYDRFGNDVGSSTTPEQTEEYVELRFIEPGRYVVRVDQFSSDRLMDTSYRLSAELIDNQEACTVNGGECARTAPIRSICNEDTGGCRMIEGDGAVALGGACDSQDDCVEEAEFCWSFEGNEFANICTRRCREASDCDDVPGTECTRIRGRFAVCTAPR